MTFDIHTETKRRIYRVLLALIAFFLPLSEWMLSFFTIVLVLFWILIGDYRNPASLVRKRKILVVFLLFYGVYLLWMINTSDLISGIRELRLKLPLLVFPLAAGFCCPLRKEDIMVILSSFIAGTVVSSLAGVALNASEVFSGLADTRELSPFISHIRLSMMAVFAIFASFSAALNEKPVKWRQVYLFAGIWLFIYLSVTFSISGIILLMAALAFAGIYSVVFIIPGYRKYLFFSALFIVFLALILFFYREVKFFYRDGGAYSLPYDSLTLNGNPYRHDTLRADIENGNPVWVYLCEDELRKEWNARSGIPYDSLDRKGQQVKYTIIRYMTSAGLRKDSAGVASLDREDIYAVENGYTNRLFTKWGPWKRKAYETIWQVDYYIKGGNPSGHSLTQRIEFMKTAFNIWKRFPFSGTGTGDLRKEFIEQYRINGSNLAPEYRLLSHNQYLTFLASFGLAGFTVIFFSILYPFFASGTFRRFLPALFLVIILVSMMWEDTLETHTGVSFFAYFYSVFVFGYEEGEKGNFEAEI